MIWIMRKKLRGGATLIAAMVTGSALAIIVGGVVLLAYSAGYTKGTATSYAQGKLDGYAAACMNVQDQARWAFNVENGYVNSKQDTPATGAKVVAVSRGVVHYVCTRTVAKTPNVYEPPLKETP